MKTENWTYLMQMCSATALSESDFVSLLDALAEEPADRILTVLARITPDIAGRLLDEKAPNRNLRVKVKSRLAGDMGSGKWKLNGQSIILDPNGRLIDGQHRCTAAKSKGATFDAIVVVGISDEASKTIDMGLKRTNSDVLGMRGIENAVMTSAALALQHRFELGHISWETNSEQPTPSRQDELLEKHPGIVKSSHFVASLSMLRSLCPSSLAVFVHYNASLFDNTKADAFFQRLSDGNGLVTGDPILVLRNRLTQNRASKARLNNREILALMIKAWNYYVSGRRISTLRWRAIGDSAEDFPAFVAK